MAILPYTPFSKTPILCFSQNPSNYHLNLRHFIRISNQKPNLSLKKLHAIASDVTVGSSSSSSGGGEGEVFVGPSSQAEVRGVREVADYDWTEEWYPLYLTENVPEDAPLGLTVFHKQLVLYRDASGEFRCYEDRCPHRLAKLSEGQLVDGRLECLYHGWQFEGEGKCVKIPQLPAGAKIPK